ncbi:MAG: hypothetical protein K1W15_04470 [Lachnospiraceae bacterium]
MKIPLNQAVQKRRHENGKSKVHNKKAGKDNSYNIITPGGMVLGQFKTDNTPATDTGLDGELIGSIYKACNAYIETLYMKGIRI